MQLQTAQFGQLAKSLSREVSGEVLTDPHSCGLYSTDASLYQIRPAAVVLPRTPQDIVTAVAWAAGHHISVIPRGSGTSLSGQSIGGGLVIDCSKYLDRIISVDPEAQTARIQPGVVLDALNAAAARVGLQFGPDVATSSRANLGGMIGNNSAGARSIRYGKTVDHVISLDVVMADASTARFGPLSPASLAIHQAAEGLFGLVHREIPRIVSAHRDEIADRYPALLRRVSGYNLDEFVPACRQRIPTPPGVALVRARGERDYPGADFNLSRLLVGAEGTLACITEASVHLIPLPAARGMLVLHFSSIESAIAALAAILAYGPSAAELFDRHILELAAKSFEYRNYLDFVVGQPETLLLVEFSGDSVADVKKRMQQVSGEIRGLEGLGEMLHASDPAQCDHIWRCRKAAFPLLMGVPGLRKPLAFVEDTAVPPERLPEFVRRFREILSGHGTSGVFYGHASVGCLHVRPVLDATTRSGLDDLEKISDAVCDLVIEFGGAMSGEHGDGLARSFLNERLFGPQIYEAFKQVKRAFDPQGLFNPGKIVDGPHPTANTRYGSDYRESELETVFDFSRQGGITGAADLCNGSALCRRAGGGTMCPSFRATKDEEHSTRGRANALRLALTGKLPPESITGERLFHTFDLCLQCKGCKAECPSNVDVAKLKSEFLHNYYRHHRIPLGVRALSHVAVMNRLGSALAPMSNWAAALPGGGWLREAMLGIDRRRPLPRFYRRHFRRWFQRSRGDAAQRRPGDAGSAAAGDRETAAGRGPIVLFDDCLTRYCEPGVLRAAVTVLESAGHEVHLADVECCGRAMISKGLLDGARELAGTNVARLRPWVEREVPIVGCEPSCLLTLSDDYQDLLPGENARRLAGGVRLIEDYLVGQDAVPSLAPRRGRTLIHGHCHQKALVGCEGTMALLSAMEGNDVTLLDSGCCGMAGSFGYEHYELSMRIGETVLFPALRDAADAVIAAAGFSCRHQIEHGTGRRAYHPIELVAAALR